jgi:hypothetical protein
MGRGWDRTSDETSARGTDASREFDLAYSRGSQRPNEALDPSPRGRNPGPLRAGNRGSTFLQMVETVGIEPTSAVA